MLDSQKWNKKEHTPGPRADLTPDSRRSREWHFKNAAVWLSPSRKSILGLPCFWSEICVFLPWFVYFFNYFQLFLSNPSWCLHFSLQNAYLIYGSYFLQNIYFFHQKMAFIPKIVCFWTIFFEKTNIVSKVTKFDETSENINEST